MIKKLALSILLIPINSFAQEAKVTINKNEVILNNFKQTLVKESSNISFSENICDDSFCKVDVLENKKIIQNITISSKINILNDKTKFQIKLLNISKNYFDEYTIVCSQNNKCNFFNGKESSEIDDAFDAKLSDQKQTSPFIISSIIIGAASLIQK